MGLSVLRRYTKDVIIDLDALPDEVDALRQLVRDLAAQGDGDRAELAQAQTEIQRLRLIIQRLQRHQFGRRSERIDGDQLQLGLEDLEVDTAEIESRLPARSPRSPRFEIRALRPAASG